MVYGNIRKKRRVYVDEDGMQSPLDKRSGPSHYFMVAASGTLSAAGDLTVTGTQFKPDTVVTASYNGASAGTAPIAIELGDSTVTFKGDASASLYYTAINLSV